MVVATFGAREDTHGMRKTVEVRFDNNDGLSETLEPIHGPRKALVRERAQASDRPQRAARNRVSKTTGNLS